jgi:hypothetical protein
MSSEYYATREDLLSAGWTPNAIGRFLSPDLVLTHAGKQMRTVHLYSLDKVVAAREGPALAYFAELKARHPERDAMADQWCKFGGAMQALHHRSTFDVYLGRDRKGRPIFRGDAEILPERRKASGPNL